MAAPMGLVNSPSENINNDNVQHINSTRDYSINIDRVLRRKISTCREVAVDYNYTNGGVRGLMDTATFELFRSACSAFYGNLPDGEGYVQIDSSSDKQKKAEVQLTYKVRRNPSSRFGYTINLYVTNSTLLINGRDIERFMTEHLPIIHEIMWEPIRGGEFQSVMQLNNILAHALSDVLRQLNGETSPQPTPPRPQTPVNDLDIEIGHIFASPEVTGSCRRGDTSDDVSPDRVPTEVASNSSRNETPENIKCAKCKKNCLTRAAVCDMGNHWVHYRCDQLTPHEIDRLSNDSFTYNCKACRSEHTVLKLPRLTPPSNCVARSLHTEPKTIVSPRINATSALDDEVRPKTVVSPRTNPTLAAEILRDEIAQSCDVCNMDILSTEVACGKCNAACHINCMDALVTDLCKACAATNNQRELQGEMETVSIQTPSPDRTNQAKVQVKDIKSSIQTNSTKQRELRQLEMRLKKWETELKLKEVQFADKEKENRRLEDYLRKTEARNNELEQTIRTLQRRINVAEQFNIETPNVNGETANVNISNLKASNANNIFNQQPLSGTDNLIHSVHERVTRFIMDKVDKQIQQLETLDNVPPSTPCVEHASNRASHMCNEEPGQAFAKPSFVPEMPPPQPSVPVVSHLPTQPEGTLHTVHDVPRYRPPAVRLQAAHGQQTTLAPHQLAGPPVYYADKRLKHQAEQNFLSQKWPRNMIT
ncbi:MAG: hypothetical protein ABW185_28765 [Sedimenticola sp.]